MIDFFLSSRGSARGRPVAISGIMAIVVLTVSVTPVLSYSDHLMVWFIWYVNQKL